MFSQFIAAHRVGEGEQVGEDVVQILELVP